MASNDVDGYRYYSCEKCVGRWIPGEAIDRAMTKRGFHNLPAFTSPVSTVILCPCCKAACRIIKIEKCEVDVCEKCHGIWIDRDEVLRLESLFPQDSSIIDAEQSRGRKWSVEDVIMFILVAIS